jgi:hypothetical protein
MRELRILREVQRRQSRASQGFNPRTPADQVLHVAAAAHELDILSLPEDVSSLADAQQADGSFYFMLGFSSLGGDDPLA